MARILDTTPAFDAFARKAYLESPATREQLWVDGYEAAHPEVFVAFAAANQGQELSNPLVRELSRVRGQAAEGGPVTRELIEELEPAVAGVLGLAADPSPLHVLMVDRFSTNAVVGRLHGEVALFHCLEWFQSVDAARVVVAHEDVHAWHELVLGIDPPTHDAAWTAFSEGLAIQVSKVVVPGRAEDDYFWYGHEGFEEWLPWCRGNRDDLFERFRSSLDDPETTEAFFGGGLVEGRWRVGYFVADGLVEIMDRPPAELVAMSVPDAQAAVRAALGC